MCFAASACSFATSNQAPAGSSPSRPPEPRRVWNASTTPSCDGGTPDRDELGQGVAHRRAHPPAAELGPGALDRRRVEVLLERDVGDLRELAPPRAGVAAREGLARDEQERVPALRLQQPRPLEHVRAVAGGRRRPRRRRRGAEELVHHDHRVGAAGREDGEVEDALRLRREPRGSAGFIGVPTRVAQVHVPVDRLRARRPRLRRVVGAGAGDDHARAAEDGDQLGRAVVDPERLRLGQAARSQPWPRRPPQGSMRRRRRQPPEASSRDTARPAGF